ncbi:MAG: hypothetical protein WCT44_02980 [Candidatus Paceibacterota bacterium]
MREVKGETAPKEEKQQVLAGEPVLLGQIPPANMEDPTSPSAKKEVKKRVTAEELAAAYRAIG